MRVKRKCLSCGFVNVNLLMALILFDGRALLLTATSHALKEPKEGCPLSALCRCPRSKVIGQGLVVKCKATHEGTLPRFDSTVTNGRRVVFDRLVLRGVGLKYADGESFENVAVRALDLSDNPFDIDGISREALEPLAPEMITLSLVNCSLLNVPRGQAWKLRSLTSLDLQYNLIRKLQAKDFEGLSSLVQLSLGGNFIFDIDESVFSSSVPRLLVLNLERNKIRTVPMKLLRNLTALNALDLQGNLMVRLPNRLFLDQRRLESLELSANRLSSIGAGTFRGLLNLKHLHMTANPLRRLSTNSFRTLNALRSVALDARRLRILSSLLFANAPELKTLILDDVRVARLPTDFLEHNKKLSLLQVGNGTGVFKELSLDAFNEHFDFDGFTFRVSPGAVCNCRADWTRALIVRSGYFEGTCGGRKGGMPICCNGNPFRDDLDTECGRKTKGRKKKKVAR